MGPLPSFSNCPGSTSCQAPLSSRCSANEQDGFNLSDSPLNARKVHENKPFLCVPPKWTRRSVMKFAFSLLPAERQKGALILWEELRRAKQTTAKSISVLSPSRAERSLSCQEAKFNTSTFQACLYPLCPRQSYTIPP